MAVSVGPTIPHGGQVGCRYVFDGPVVGVASVSLTVAGVAVVGGGCVGSESILDAVVGGGRVGGKSSLDASLNVGHGDSGER